jgi:hypothetical protein
MKYIYFPLLAALLIITSCSTPKLAVPEQFTSVAEKMHIKGLNGWMINQKLTFGIYQTSKVKRGWNTTTTRQHKNSNVTSDERIMKLFNVQNTNTTSNQKQKYQYSIEDGNQVAEVFCSERMSAEELKVFTNNRWLGDFSQTKNYQYSFTAAIAPLKINEEPWQLVVYNNYDRTKDTAKRFFDLPYVEEEGFATNGKDTITVKPVRIKNVTSKDGKERQFPVKILGGYELRLDDGVIGVIDTMGHALWIYKELDKPTKLIVASICSALMLRKIQDVNG